jgi:hypothetical protein
MGEMIKDIVAPKVRAYSEKEDMYGVRTVQKKFRDSFVGSTLNSLNWDVKSKGAGQTIAVNAGVLTISAGVGIDQETVLVSKEYFTPPFRSLFGFMASQKITNQELHLEIVSIDEVTLEPDDKCMAAWKMDNAGTASQAYYRTQNGGMVPLDSALVTAGTWTGWTIHELELFIDEMYYHVRTMDTTTGRAYSYKRDQQIPDPNALYKLRIRVKNLGTAPASNTDYKFQFVTCIDYAEVTAEITSGRGNMVAGQGIYATVGGSVNINGSPTVVGPAAHDAAVSGSPVRIAGRALTLPYNAVATGDVADLVTTLIGALIVKPYSIPENEFSYASAAIIATTDQVAKVAGAAGIRNYVTGLQLHNSHATVGTEVVVKDGATVIWRGYLPPLMNHAIAVVFNTPLRGTAATALNFACITTGANVYANIQGYQAP